MRFALGLLLALTTGFSISMAAETATVVPAKAAIVVPAEADAPVKAAADDLAKHLKLITGQEIAVAAKPPDGAYAFNVGIPFPGDDKALAPEEARWVITPTAAWLYGESKYTGAQFAVSCFLEDQLGVRWVEPGERGIAFRKQTPLVMRCGQYSWAPKLLLRKIRMRDREVKELPVIVSKGDLALFDGFRRTLAETNNDAVEGREWQLHMRMGGHDTPIYGHAFTKWWDRFGKTHPEYFALTANGKREPMPDPRPREAKTDDAPFTARERMFVKICVSNPKVVEQIVKDWLPAKDRVKYINTCENDMPYGFCQCPDCVKLDAPLAGEKFGKHLSDRYVWFSNAVAREARKHRPDVIITTHAYDGYDQPPRREKLEPDIYVSMVPTTFDLAALKKWFEGWRAAGAAAMQMRPNFHWYYATISLPMGYERHMFDVFQLAVANGCISADFDSIKRNWPTTGMFNYILAKQMSDTSKPYEHWEEHYLSAYGAAAPEVREYYRYWQTELWDKRLCPAMGKLAPAYNFNFCGNLMKNVGAYYKAGDFDRTDAILQAAAKKALEASEKARLDRLILANQHARLVFNAITTPMPGKVDQARKLLELRNQHRNDLSVTWIDIFAVEDLSDGEVGTGLAAAAKQGK